MYKKRLNEYYLSFPPIAWLTIFFLIPTMVILAFAFKPFDGYGGFMDGWTLRTFFGLLKPGYIAIFWQTLWISIVTTLICLSLSLPIGYFLARTTPGLRHICLLLVVIPFWSSFLIRIFAWKSLLHPEGFIKKALVSMHLIHPDTLLLYNSGAVLLVLVYSYLPFGILPIFASASKFNFQLTEAAEDLGCSRIQAFFKVFVPGIKVGIITSFLMVFIPTLGAYVIPDVVGGTDSEMIGNKIAQKIFVDRNLPEASALSAILAFVVLFPMTIFALLSTKNSKEAIIDARGKQ
jgi:spermidine/putrescine transport system permease protein